MSAPDSAQAATIECQNEMCKAPMSIRIPIFKIYNELLFSQMIATHGLVTCQRCGTVHTLSLEGAENTQWKTIAVGKSQSKIVVPS